MLSSIPHGSENSLLVGYGGADDAAVYQIDEGRAIVCTVDFITPPVDDPFWFGQIGAANALSDIYAMGGKPLFALNLVMFPMKKLGKEVLKEILRGAAEKVREAGAVLGGGHSVDDEEPKFGLSVTGIVGVDDILRNGGALPGDRLILTKPLGTGVLFNGVKSGRLTYGEVEKLLPHVAMLNDRALPILRSHRVRALTDVTGFGIGGHILEVAKESRVSMKLYHGQLPLHPHVLSLYQMGETTGSNGPNRKNLEGFIQVRSSISAAKEEILFDPQTSGGLLGAVPAEEAEKAVDDLRKGGYEGSAIVGEVVEKEEYSLIVE